MRTKQKAPEHPKPRQLRFAGMPRAPRPTIRNKKVALAIATRIVAEVNIDDYYWKPEEIGNRVGEVQHEIMRAGRPATVFSRLEKQQPPINERNHPARHPYGWEGIDSECRLIADEIAADELRKAIEEWMERYKG